MSAPSSSASKQRRVQFAFTGLKGSGKSTASDAVGNAENDVPVVAFAMPLKSLVNNLFSLTNEDIQDKEVVIERLGVSYRQLLQTIGTELFREQLPALLPTFKYRSIWIELLLQQVRGWNALGKNVCVDDCRFADEYEALKKEGFIVVRITRPSQGASIDAHASEAGCPFDLEIVNDGTIQQLANKVISVVGAMQETQL